MVGGGVGAGACWCEAHEARAKPAKAVREAIILVSFMVKEEEYGLYIHLDPFFVVARMVDGQAELVEGEAFDRIQPRIEAELEEREWPE